MPWPKEHKSRTRRTIVAAASTAFRAEGISGVRVGDVMTRAGLTHGGFYAHFDSKADLLREALDYAAEQTVEALSKPLADVPSEARWRTVIDSYLSPTHVAHPDALHPARSVLPPRQPGGRSRAGIQYDAQTPCECCKGSLGLDAPAGTARTAARRGRRGSDWLGGVYAGRRDPGARGRWQRGERDSQCLQRVHSRTAKMTTPRARWCLTTQSRWSQ